MPHNPTHETPLTVEDLLKRCDLQERLHPILQRFSHEIRAAAEAALQELNAGQDAWLTALLTRSQPAPVDHPQPQGAPDDRQ